jgi:Spo0E like sporulation regulatory protein
MRSLTFIDSELNKAKKQLADLYETKGYTDCNVLKLGEKIDRLLNERSKAIQ